MKFPKILIYFCRLTLVVLVALEFVLVDSSVTFAKSKNTQQLSDSFDFSDLMKPMYAEPIKVSLDGKDFKNVVDIGLDRAGLIEDPKEWNSVGWFTKSARVGEPGNLIVTGHYDDTLGQPAAFWQLKNVKVGDKVVVEDDFGKFQSYSVTDSFYLDINDPRRLEILKNDSSVSEMTLITCSGKWIANEGTYDKRLVVKAQLN